MKPIFKNSIDWEQAEALIQPSLIRVIDNLRKKLETSLWKETYTEVETPYPGHQLNLTYQDHQYAIALWDICFEVCFLDYQILSPPDRTDLGEQEVSIDTSLFRETGEIDWQKLETKTQKVIDKIFANLPTV
jgi:hypothetical protein